MFMLLLLLNNNSKKANNMYYFYKIHIHLVFWDCLTSYNDTQSSNKQYIPLVMLEVALC
jgi:hypothetical protein